MRNVVRGGTRNRTQVSGFGDRCPTTERCPPHASKYSAPGKLFPGDPRFFVRRLLAAPVAELLELYLPLHGLFVLVGIVIAPFADGTAHGDQPVGAFYFCHMEDSIFRPMPIIKVRALVPAIILRIALSVARIAAVVGNCLAAGGGCRRGRRGRRNSGSGGGS